MSSALALKMYRGKQSHMASTSRWQCMVPLGGPVVPEVKAISATSSAAVSQLSKPAGLSLANRSTSASPSPVAVKYKQVSRRGARS